MHKYGAFEFSLVYLVVTSVYERNGIEVSAVDLKFLLSDRKKVIITEDSIRQALRLDDADSDDCLPNEDIFAELARMGYEKPSTNLVRNVDSTSKFYMYLRFLQLIINAQIADLSSHNTKYKSPALTQKAFANMRKVGKGFSGVDTPLFAYMLVPQQAQDVENDAEDKDDVNELFDEPTPSSPTPATPPLPPQKEHIPSPPQAETAQPSPPAQQQPSQTAKTSLTLLNTLLETYATLTKQDVNLEQDNIAQAIKITKIKKRVKHLEKKRQFKSLGGKIAKLDADEDVTLIEVDAKVPKDTDVKRRLEESQAKVKPAEVEEVIKVVTAAKLMIEVVTTATTPINAASVPKTSALRRRRGVIIQDLEEAPTASVKRKERQDNTVMRYQALKRKPITEAQARKNMMVYLKNMVGFKMDFFRGMTCIEIRPIFEKHYNLNQAFLERVKEEVTGQEEEVSKRKSESFERRAAKKQRIDEEVDELKTHLQIVPNDEDGVYTKVTPLALKFFVADYQIYHEDNKPFYKIIRADGTHQLFLSFVTLLRNFNREDLEILMLKQAFREIKEMILLVERKYPLTRYTLEQMLNNVRLEVEEESKMSLELLRLMRRQQQEGYKPEEDLEMLWKIVQERFESSEPKNFLDDFLLNTLKTMFEKPNAEANI
uniref:Uncharacterized protein n=1 Tax=Tanacetum cinerariifolium TaxID=118510 RepID=A0A6L2L5Y8_TANCI|nr:hypothetical protein [Tanacetum cinerariifolium]